MYKLNVLAAATLALSCLGSEAATIDRMNTATFGHYAEEFNGGEFMIFSQADNYQLNNGTSWKSGAGWHPATYVTFAGVTTSGSSITYAFNAPTSGLLFTNTDYDRGDHSAQGELGLPDSLSIVATLGGNTGVISGYAQIISNNITEYGEPRFNYYSAPVGSKVYFEQHFSLLDTTFTADLFSRTFIYNETGFVDFTHTAPVPEPSTSALSLLGLAIGSIFLSFKKVRMNASA